MKNLLKNRRLAQAISDAGWGQFVRFLAYKLERRGGRLVKVNRFFPSSKTYHACDYQVDELPLSVRVWTCPGCGAVLDWDDWRLIMTLSRILGAGLLLFAAGLYGQSGGVTYSTGLLTVNFNNSELKSALEQITQQTGVKFSVSSKLEEAALSDTFSGVPLEQGIRRLLKGYNYIMVFEDEANQRRRLDKVILLARSQEGEAVRQPGVAQGTPRPGQPNEIVLPKQNGGHYSTTGRINNSPVEFLVDTGATSVTISGALAAELGLAYGPETVVHTANGDTTGFTTILENVDLGGLPLQRIAAVILPNMTSGRQVLLGMSVLQGFEIVQQQDKLIIRNRRRMP